jgi:hypothetical protein
MATIYTEHPDNFFSMDEFADNLWKEMEQCNINAGHAERALIVAIEDAIKYCGYERTKSIIIGEFNREN